MTAIENLTPANDNVSLFSESGKGQIFDAVDKMDIAPEVQNQLDATEGIFLKTFGIEISFGRKFNPGDRVEILDMRRYPEEYVDTEVLPILERIEKAA